MVKFSGRFGWVFAAALLSVGTSPAWLQASPCGCQSCDLDHDSDVDQVDFGLLQACITGFTGVITPECMAADLDGNGVINNDDYAAFNECSAGPGVPVASGDFDGVYITEFMASNGSTLADEDGDHPDWIELYNPCRPSLNLEGWYLTDDPALLTKWRFPAIALAKGKFLVVFASDKDRDDPAHPLHTNFKLSSEGDFLALVAPDGQTIVHSYQPKYSEQLTDISFGITQSASKLIAVRANAKYRVPTKADIPVGSTWTALDYDDTSWPSGPTGLGFSSVPAYFTVTVYKSNIGVGDLTTAESVIADTTRQAWTSTVTANYIDYFNSGGTGNFGNNLPFPNMQGGGDYDDFVVLVTGTVVIPSAGEWTFGVNSDDGFGLKLTRGAQVFQSSYPQLRGPGDTMGVFSITDPGTYDVRLTFFEHGGGSGLEFFAAQGNHPIFDSAFHLVGDTANGGMAVGVLGGTIGTDIGTVMRNKNCSVWLRLPFQVSDPAVYNLLSLSVQYEDGFVAFLNGHEIVRRNAPANLTYGSPAASDRPLAAATEPEVIDISSFLGLLKIGKNVLAIQGMNDIPTNPDFLILPELTAGSTVNQAQYFLTPTPGTFNTSGSVDFVRSLTFSVDHGFFNSPQQLSITTPTPGVTIRYTLDGSTPTETTGQVYTGPLTIDRTRVVRAAGFRTGFLSSSVVTRTYLFVNDVLTQSPNGEVPSGFPASGAVNNAFMSYGMDPLILSDARYTGLVDDSLLAIPTISLATDLPNLFDPSYGIYVNPGGEGRAWERATSVELLNPDGTPGFQIDAGLRIRGGYSRSSDNPKHAFRLFFRSDYGQGKLAYPLFGAEGPGEFDKVDLATAQNYSWSFEHGDRNTFLRDLFSRDSQRDMGDPYSRGRFYHLYIDGVYWGLYYTDERTEANYAASYFGGSDNDYDVVKVEAGPYTIYATDGDMDAWYRLWVTCGEDGVTQTSPVMSNETFQKIQGRNPDGTRNNSYEVMVDVDNLIDYMLCTIFVADPDGPVAWGGDFPNNFYAIRHRSGLSGFKFFRHDAEHSLGNATGDPNDERTGPYIAGYSFDRFNPFRIHQDMATCSDYRSRFMDRAYQVLFNGGAFTPQASINRVKIRRDQIDMAIIAESARWGDAKGEPARNKIDDWVPAVNWLLNNYLPNRTNVVAQQLRNKSWFIDPPSFSRAGGNVSVGTEVVLTPPAGNSGTLYFTMDGSDPRLPGDGLAPQAQVYTVSSGSTTLLPKHSTWKYLDDHSNQGTSWYATGFNDAAWKQGPGQLGYSPDEGDEATVVSYGTDAAHKYPTTYFRTTFTVPADKVYTSLQMNLVRDDSAVVYLNGQRACDPINMPASWDYSTYSGSIVSGTDENTYFPYTLDISLLHPGQNLIAVEMHQGSADSSDLSFDMELIGNWSTASNPVVITQNTRMKARMLTGGIWSAANQADYLVGPVPLYLNEVLASNALGLEDPDEPGEQPDWFELYNPNTFQVDLGGLYVTDTLTVPNKWRLPTGLTIQGGQFLVFYADDDGTQGPTHVGFKLSNSGEAVGLFDRDGVTPIDTISFGPQATDVSFGRYPDGTGSWAATTAPTPQAPNAPHAGP